jgi:hypothetical protein
MGFREWLLKFFEPMTVVTVLLFGATFGLYRATDNLVTDARIGTEKQLRAYVYITLRPRKFPSIEPTMWDINMTITNAGKTWARNVRIAKSVVEGTEAVHDPFDSVQWNDSEPEQFVIGPGETKTLQFQPIPFTVLKEKISTGALRYNYFAWVKYRDAFSDETRQTQLFQYVNGNDNGTPSGVISFTYRPTHNCADDDCLPKKEPWPFRWRFRKRE